MSRIWFWVMGLSTAMSLCFFAYSSASAQVIPAVPPAHNKEHAAGLYDGSCCGNRDCRPLKLGEVERRDNGWYILVTGETIPFDGDPRVRESRDHQLHGCVVGTQTSNFMGHKIVEGAKLKCLYVPSSGI